ncbi:MAG: class I SAM-dependent methyltransferase [Desulfobulbaceae bacterium]
MKKVLNVGGNDKAIALPPQYAAFDQLLLDIDPGVNPDIVGDARQLEFIGAGRFDAVYCSHNLEHYYRHEVGKVLAGFLYVLKAGGFAHIRVPDIQEVMRVTVERGLDIDDVLYQSPAGPIRVGDVLYGFSVEIERSGKDYFAHKTGFTRKSLWNALKQAGFQKIYCTTGNFEIDVLAFKGEPDQAARELFGLPRD